MVLSEITANDIEDNWASITRLPKLTLGIPKKYKFEVEYPKQNAALNKQQLRENRWGVIHDNDDIESLKLNATDLYSPAQLKKISTFLKNIFHYAQRKKYIKNNPFKQEDISLNIPKNRVSKIRTSLPKDKAALIVEHCAQNLDDPHSWPILLMAYLGLRNEEATNLLADQVITDPESYVVYIQIKKGKTINAIRKVPLHDRLLELGFQSLAERTEQNQRLFNVESKHLTHKFSSFRSMFDIPKLDKDGCQLVLYSFRHNVISSLGDTSDEQKYRLVGHGHYTVTTNYTKLDLIRAQELINKVQYD